LKNFDLPKYFPEPEILFVYDEEFKECDKESEKDNQEFAIDLEYKTFEKKLVDKVIDNEK